MQLVHEYAQAVARNLSVAVPEELISSLGVAPSAVVSDDIRRKINAALAVLPTEVRTIPDNLKSGLNLFSAGRANWKAQLLHNQRNDVVTREAHFRDYSDAFVDSARKLRESRDRIVDIESIPITPADFRGTVEAIIADGFYTLTGADPSGLTFKTSPIVLHCPIRKVAVPMGEFYVKLTSKRETMVKCAAGNNYSPQIGTFPGSPHPFVKPDARRMYVVPCYGEAADGLAEAISSDNLCDIMVLTRVLLTTYDIGASPYAALEHFPVDRAHTCTKCNVPRTRCPGCDGCGRIHTDCVCKSVPVEVAETALGDEWRLLDENESVDLAERLADANEELDSDV